MNTVILQGNLIRDPELKYTATGTAVCEFSVALNEEFTNKKGEKCETVTFIDCKAWKGMAEKVGESYRKGTAAVVVGKLRTDSWEDRETKKKRYKTYVLADAVTSPFGKPKEKEQAPPPARGSAPVQPDLNDNVPY